MAKTFETGCAINTVLKKNVTIITAIAVIQNRLTHWFCWVSRTASISGICFPIAFKRAR